MIKLFRSFRLFVAVIAVILAYGCGGGGESTSGSPQSPPPSVSSVTISGAAIVSAPFQGGAVNAYHFGSGVKGAFIAGAPINNNGQYSLTVPRTAGLVLLEAGGACYEDKAIRWVIATAGLPLLSNAVNSQVCAAPNALSAIVSVSTSASAVSGSITPFTHAAAGLTEYKIRMGTAAATAAEESTDALSAWLGLNIQTTATLAPSLNNNMSDGAFYGAIIASIPSWLLNRAANGANAYGSPARTSLVFAEAMRDDLREDGVFNGIGRDAAGNTTVLTINGAAMSADVYRHQLAFYAMIRIRAETQGATNSATVEEYNRIETFFPALIAYNNATNALLRSSATIPLDEGSPLINVLYPAPGYVLTGSSGIAAAIHDNAGINHVDVQLSIDGTYYTGFLNPYQPNHFINTTIFANGVHTLTLRATNRLGHISSASVNVVFSN